MWDLRNNSVKNVFYNQALNTLFNFGCRSFKDCMDHFIISPEVTDSNFQRISLFCDPISQISRQADIFITDPPWGDTVNYEVGAECWSRTCCWSCNCWSNSKWRVGHEVGPHAWPIPTGPDAYIVSRINVDHDVAVGPARLLVMLIGQHQADRMGARGRRERVGPACHQVGDARQGGVGVGVEELLGSEEHACRQLVDARTDGGGGLRPAPCTIRHDVTGHAKGGEGGEAHGSAHASASPG